jgi:hypothetical protein
MPVGIRISDWPHDLILRFSLIVTLYFFAAMFMFVSFRATRRYRLIENALENFATYDSEFQSKWVMKDSAI